LLALVGARHFVHVSRIKVKVDLKELVREGVDWIGLVQDWGK
jgi:hypothetical protein